MFDNVAYIAVLAVAVVEFVALLKITKYQKSTYFILLFVTTVFVSVTYVAVSMAKNSDEALLATKLSYFGGTFLTFFLMLGMCQICGIRIRRWWTVSIVLINIEILVSVFTAGYLPWHYSEYELRDEGGIAYLAKEYGPHHKFYMVILIMYMIIPIAIVIYSIYHRNKASWIYVALLGAGEILVIISYFAERALHLRLELLPFGYVFYQFIILIILRRIAIYDVAANVRFNLENRDDHGYAILDGNRNFVGADDVARKFFPELNELSLDRPIMQPLLRKEVEPKYLQRGDKDLKVMVKPFYHKAGGSLTGFMLEIVDDTKTQTYIRELKEANKKLEELAKRADAANTAKSEFLSNISHEIRTPINAVLGLNEMVIRETDQDSIKGYARDIEGAGATLLSLINGLLDMSKIEAGKMELVPASYESSSMLNDIINMAGIRAKEKNLEFIVNVDPNLPVKLFGDEVRLKQIVMNILINAVKYTEQGSVTLNVGFASAGESAVKIDFSVSDTGIGMKEEALEKLFIPFERLDEVRNRHVEGTGLGLAISQKLLAMMGSKLKVKSEYGVGSTFSFSVEQKVEDPTPIGDVKDALKLLKDEEAVYSETFKAPEAKVLVVDDIKVNVKVFMGLLKQTEVKVEGAYSGIEAVEKCECNDYDVIYMDHMMPEMDGIEAMRRIRTSENGRNKKTPMIIMTANATHGAREEYLKEGFDDYISKPLEPAALEQSLIDYLPKEKVELSKK